MNNNNVIQIPEEYKPLSPWAYIGYQLLFALPCIGIILLFVFGFGSNTNINLKNFARSYLFVYLIAIGISVLLIILGFVFGGFAALIDSANF